MLILTRRHNEQLVIRPGEQSIVIRIVSVTRDRARLSISADPAVAVHREEVVRRIAGLQKDRDAPLDAGAPPS